MGAVVGTRRRRQRALGPFQDPPLPLPIGLHQRALEQRLGVRLQVADELERGGPHQRLRGRRVQQRRARDVPALHGNLVRNPPAETNPSNPSRQWDCVTGNRLCFGCTESAFSSLRLPDGVSLEAVGAPGEQLADAVQVPAARGQMQRRAPGESEEEERRARARRRVKCCRFPQKARRIVT